MGEVEEGEGREGKGREGGCVTELGKVIQRLDISFARVDKWFAPLLAVL